MARIEKTIFISYRRKDISWALAVYQYLTGRKYDVFFDYTSLSGGDFEQVIVSNIKARAHFVLILTPTALDRCNEPGDWLRREIELAVDEKRNILPLIFDGFSFSTPSIAEKLTGKLSYINRYNGLDVPAGYFIEAMERLSTRYLNVPLNAVIHPIPTEVVKVVKDEQLAANMALIQKSEAIKELVKPAEEVSAERKQEKRLLPLMIGESLVGSKRNLVHYGVGLAILLIVLAGIVSISTLLNRVNGNVETPGGGSLVAIDTAVTEPSVISTALTAPAELEIPIPTDSISAEDATITPIDIATMVPSSSSQVSTKDGSTLIYIPSGTFLMGLTEEQKNLLRQLCNTDICEGLYQVSSPANQVELTKSYWIYRTEVSNSQYAICVNAGKCSPPRSYSSAGQASYYDNPDFANYPVVWVDWDRANTYCAWAGGRLPTSAEWEYAARKDDGRLFSWGNDQPDGRQANVDSFIGVTTATDRFVDYPSPFGLLDMTGNVWEWVFDWYDPAYYDQNTNWTDPMGPPEGVYKVGRGGSWWIPGALSSVAIQDWEVPNSTDSSYSYDGVGFRCAMDASE